MNVSDSLASIVMGTATAKKKASFALDDTSSSEEEADFLANAHRPVTKKRKPNVGHTNDKKPASVRQRYPELEDDSDDDSLFNVGLSKKDRSTKEQTQKP